MEQNFSKEFWGGSSCPPIQCKKSSCRCGLRFVSLPGALGDDSLESDIRPKNGEYCNAIVKYEANGAVYIYSKEGIPVLVKEGDAS